MVPVWLELWPLENLWGEQSLCKKGRVLSLQPGWYWWWSGTECSQSLPTWGSWIKGFFHFHRVHLYAGPPKGPAFNAEGLKIRTEELKAAPSHFWRNWLLIWAVRHIALPYCYSSRLCLTHSLCGCLCYSPFSYICEGTAFNQNTAVFRGQGAKGEGARTNARSLPFPVCSFTGEQLLCLPSPQPGREKQQLPAS